MALYDVYIEEFSLERGAPIGKIAWSTRKRASSRVEALLKAMPEIKRKVLPRITDSTIKFISVFVGRYKSITEPAFRLEPIQITRGGKLRRPGLYIRS